MSWQYILILLFVYLLSFAVLSGPHSWWTLGLGGDPLWEFRWWLWQLHLEKWGFRESSTGDGDHSRGLVAWINQCINQSMLIAINPLWINLNRSTHCLIVMPGAGTDPCQRKPVPAGFRGASYPQAPWCHPCMTWVMQFLQDFLMTDFLMQDFMEAGFNFKFKTSSHWDSMVLVVVIFWFYLWQTTTATTNEFAY